MALLTKTATNPVITCLELFAGVGMLGEGIRAGIKYLGGNARTICYVERDAYPAALLVARIQDECLDDAPIWSDVVTFDAKPFYGKVDFVIAGFPCQDLSIAGRREGLDGARSGLFFEVLRIAKDCGARGIFLENVAGIASAKSTFMDAQKENEEYEERAASRVVGELSDHGYDAEWATLRASDVGASHERNRWFCLAWQREKINIKKMADSGLQHEQLQQREIRQKFTRSSRVLANAANVGRERRTSQRRQTLVRLKHASVVVLPNANQSQRRERSASRLFAPAQNDPSWHGIISANQAFSPALEPDFCGAINGYAVAMDKHRNARLKCLGNAVVPLCAATAFVALFRRAGLNFGE